MIKHIFIITLIAALVLAVVPNKVEAMAEVAPVTTQSREMLYPKLKWSKACQDKYLYNLAVDNVIAYEGLKFTMITPTYYILSIQCDQIFSETESIGVYEYMEVQKFRTELYPRQLITFKSQYMNSMGKYVDFERTQIRGNPVVKGTPNTSITNFEPYNFNDITKPMPAAKAVVDPYACGVFEEFRIQKKVSKPTMKAITVKISNVCGEYVPKLM